MAEIIKEAAEADRKSKQSGAKVKHFKNEEMIKIKKTLRERLLGREPSSEFVHVTGKTVTVWQATRKGRFEKYTNLSAMNRNTSGLKRLTSE